MVLPVFATLISDAVVGLRESIRHLEGDHSLHHDKSRAQRTSERRRLHISPFLFRVLRWATVPFTSSGVSGRKTSWGNFSVALLSLLCRHGGGSSGESCVVCGDRPCDSRKFVGHCARHDVGVSSRKHLSSPIDEGT